MKIHYSSTFFKKVKRLEIDLQEEVLEKIELIKNGNSAKRLKIHKLHGRLGKSYGLSINYKIRAIFYHEKNGDIVFFDVGEHDQVYR
ncbi:MAG: hypothetical protein WCO84_03255 [bacterium]